MSVRLWRVLAAFGLVTAGLILSLDANARVSPASAATCGVARTPNPGLSEPELSGVSVTSSRNAWAVGFRTVRGGGTRTLIERWNGKAWKVQPSPNPGVYLNGLSGVAATSATNAWAVGEDGNGLLSPTLIEHWNGKAWKVQASPNPSAHQPGDIRDRLSGVAATSSTNAWAVGSYLDAAFRSRTLIEHWNGKAWKVQPSPNPGADLDELVSVAATSATNAWAVGYQLGTVVGDRTLIEHWNGKAWKVQSSPNPPSVTGLSGVAATSSTNAWAVGNANARTVIEHWNGKAWKVQPSPKLRGSWLSGVAAASSTNAWAVGRSPSTTAQNPGSSHTLIEHWNGKAWKVQGSPDPRGFNVNALAGVGTTAAATTTAWAVGYSGHSDGRAVTPEAPLAVYCR